MSIIERLSQEGSRKFQEAVAAKGAYGTYSGLSGDEKQRLLAALARGESVGEAVRGLTPPKDSP